MEVTREQLHEKLDGLENKLSINIDTIRNNLQEFRADIDTHFVDWLSTIRTDIENSRIVAIEEFKKESQLQRYYFRQDMEIMMKKQREEFNADITRHMSVLAGEYQWRLATVGEKVDMTWEKCEREHGVFEQKDMTLADKVALLEEYLPTYPRNHKGIGQAGRKSEKKRVKKKGKKD